MAKSKTSKQGKLPIVVIPGIQGTKLLDSNQNDFKTIWSGIRKFFSNIHQLRLKKNGVSDQGLETIIERADVEDLAYSELINYLKSKGYKVFIFGYDWRKSNLDSAHKLAEFVDAIRLRYRNLSGINFITHSMGALVFSAYLRQLSADERHEVVHRAVMTVPPFLGSVEACMSIVIGQSLLFNTSEDFRKVARTFPAIYELLPCYDGAYAFDNDNSAPQDIFDFDSYWQQLDAPYAVYKKSAYAFLRHRLRALEKVRQDQNLIFDFAQADEALKEKCIVVLGVGSETRSTIKIKQNENNYRYLFSFETDPTADGDGTVARVSAETFKDDLVTLAVEKSTFESWIDSRIIGRADQHAFVLNNGRVQNIITRFLSGDTERDNWFKSAGKGVTKL